MSDALDTHKLATVDAMTPRVAHALHGLLAATRAYRMPPTAAEACEYDAYWEASTPRHTAQALRASGLAACSRGVWVASMVAEDLRRALEERFLRDEALAWVLGEEQT